jgi:hypothetical protein
VSKVLKEEKEEEKNHLRVVWWLVCDKGTDAAAVVPVQ